MWKFKEFFTYFSPRLSDRLLTPLEEVRYMKQKKRLILVLDDDPTVSIVIRGLLQSRPYNMRFVSNIEKAKAALKSDDQFEILITDVHLPDGNSLDHFEEYRELNPELSIVVMTKFNNETVTEKAWNQGAVEFIEKPIEKNHLMHALDSVVEKGKSPIKSEHRKLTTQLFHFVQDRDIPVFDHKRLVKNLGGDIELCQLALGTYAGTIEEDLKSILDAVVEQDEKKAGEAIHKLKGASETIMAFQVVHALRQMEKTMKSGGVLTEFDCHELNRISEQTQSKIKIWLNSSHETAEPAS